MKTQELIKIKEGKTSLPINIIFKKRFSPRVFSQEPVKDEDIRIIFEAVRFTQSSFNLQPWYFYLAKKESQSFQKLSSLLFSGNEWAKQAPLLILGCYIKESPYGENHYATYDLGQATATLVYQAQDLGYYSHQMAGFDQKKAKEIVKDKTHIPWVMIALGKIGDYEKTDEKIISIDSEKPGRKEKVYEFI